MSLYVLLLIILIPLIGAIFAISIKNNNYSNQNIYNVAIWTGIINTLAVLYVFSMFDSQKTGIQIVEKYSWLSNPKVDILLGADIFSMLLLLSVNISFLIAEIFMDRTARRSQTLIASELIFISFLNGYFLAADIVSFYIFFAAVSAPLIILVSTYASLNKKIYLFALVFII